MKKALVAFLTVALCLSLTACGKSSETENAKSNSTGQAAHSNENVQNVSDKPSQIEEKEIYNGNNVKVTVTELDQSSTYGPEIKMLIENSSDKDVIVQVEYCTVNEYMVESLMSTNVAAGKKANDALAISESSLSERGIGKFTDISFNLVILDPQTFNRIDTTDLINLETSNTGKYTQEYDDSGIVIYNENDIKVVSKDINTDDILGQNLVLYIENDSDKTVVVQCDNASVNGFMIDTLFSTTVLPSKKAIDDMTFMSSSLDENGISDITDLEFSLVIIDEAGFDRIATSEPINLTFE